MVELIAKAFLKNDQSPARQRAVYGYVCGALGIVLNLFLFAAKLIIGTVSGSISITADAFNNFSDAGSSIITIFGFLWSGRKADSEHPFGHGRIEYLCGILVSAIIIIVGGELLLSSAEKIFEPTDVYFSGALCIVLIASVVVKLYMYLYNRKCAKLISSDALKAVASDCLGDCIATLAVLACSIFTHFTDINIDAYVGAIVSILIIRAGISSVISTASPLLGNPPDLEFVDKINELVNSSPATCGIHDLVVHDYGPGKKFVSLHMEVDGNGDLFKLHDEVDRVEKLIADRLGCEAVIHMDPIDVNNPVLNLLSDKLKAAASELHKGLLVHDVRIVPGPTHSNVIFDVAIPADKFTERDTISASLETVVKEFGDDYFAVINCELSYTE
ncbi:MAG: cation transporter [Clostridia bacterium]|nr:cation transporter [Clostridia bacterium]